MKFSVLGSGSKGNSILVANNRGAVLVDAGFSARSICSRLEQVDFDPADISAIIVTHEHSDHLRGAGVFARKFSIPVYATEKTFINGKDILGTVPEASIICSGKTFSVEKFSIHPFTIPHDAADPVGLTLKSDDVQLGICTDLGYVTHLVKERLKLSQALILEMNHDLKMLMAGPYPWFLKQRIRSRSGHLSNEAGGELLKDIWHPDLQYVMLAHLSQKNNLPELANIEAQRSLSEINGAQETKIVVTTQENATEFVEVSMQERLVKKDD